VGFDGHRGSAEREEQHARCRLRPHPGKLDHAAPGPSDRKLLQPVQPYFSESIGDLRQNLLDALRLYSRPTATRDHHREVFDRRGRDPFPIAAVAIHQLLERALGIEI